MAIDIGRIAFQSFYESLYPRQTRDGLMTKWEDIGKKEQDAWRHAAVSVLQHIDKERERLEKDPNIIG